MLLSCRFYIFPHCPLSFIQCWVFCIIGPSLLSCLPSLVCLSVHVWTGKYYLPNSTICCTRSMYVRLLVWNVWLNKIITTITVDKVSLMIHSKDEGLMDFSSRLQWLQSSTEGWERDKWDQCFRIFPDRKRCIMELWPLYRMRRKIKHKKRKTNGDLFIFIQIYINIII